MLTVYGRQLVPAMQALGRWGAESMGEPQPDQAVRSEWFAVALTAFFDAEAAEDTDATIRLDIPDGPFRLAMHDGALRVDRSDAPADLSLATDVATLIAYLSGAGRAGRGARRRG